MKALFIILFGLFSVAATAQVQSTSSSKNPSDTVQVIQKVQQERQTPVQKTVLSSRKDGQVTQPAGQTNSDGTALPGEQKKEAVGTKKD